MGPRNGAMRDSACGGKHGAVVRLVRGAEIGRHSGSKADKREKPAVSIMFLHFAICGY